MKVRSAMMKRIQPRNYIGRRSAMVMLWLEKDAGLGKIEWDVKMRCNLIELMSTALPVLSGSELCVYKYLHPWPILFSKSLPGLWWSNDLNQADTLWDPPGRLMDSLCLIKTDRSTQTKRAGDKTFHLSEDWPTYSCQVRSGKRVGRWGRERDV